MVSCSEVDEINDLQLIVFSSSDCNNSVVTYVTAPYDDCNGLNMKLNVKGDLPTAAGIESR